MYRALGALIAVVVACCMPISARAAGTADASISVSGPSVADQGTKVRLTVTVANAGPDAATNLTVALHVPSGLFIDLISSSGFCTVAVGGQDVSCNAGTVAAGDSRTLPVVVSADASGTYSIPFSVTSDEADPDASNNTVTETVQVVPPSHADLFMSFMNTNAFVRATETFVVQASYTNGGPLDATGVVMSVQLATGLEYQPGPSDPRCSASGQLVQCAIGSVAVGSLAQIFIDVTADAAGSYPVTGSIQGDQPDQNPADNTDSFAIQFQPALAGVGIQFTGTLIRPLAGRPVQFDLLVFNVGPDAATGVVVQVAFPQDWTADAALSDPRCSATASGALTCVVGGLAAQSSTMIRVAGVPSSAGTFTVIATVTLDQAPGTFNQASTQVTVFTPSADLSVTVSGPAGPQDKKQPIVDTVLLRNGGRDAAEDVTLTSSWTEADGLEVEPTGITASQGTCSHVRRTVVCAVGDVPTGATVTVSITFAPAGAGTLVFDTTVSASTQDPNTANNSASISTVVVR
jgi:uncharacterized repeat protein (TIGR01451 family)